MKSKVVEGWITDPLLSEEGQKLIEIARSDMPTLVSLVEVYSKKKPLKGARISVCVIPTPETGNLIWVLKELGAEVRLCSDNIISVDDRVAAAIYSWGVPVFGKRDQSLDNFFNCIKMALEFKDKKGAIIPPTQIIDDGSDMTQLIHREKMSWIKKLKVISEQTTCGIEFSKKLADRKELEAPVVDINTGFKSSFDNHYGCRESFINAFKLCKDIMFGGKTAVIAGYGMVGKGVAEALIMAGCRVLIVEVSATRAAHALMAGLEVVKLEDCLDKADIFVTATTTPHVFTIENILKMKSGATLCNMGENQEYDAKLLVNEPGIKKVRINENLFRYSKGDWFVDSLCDGYLLNMRVAGNPPRVLAITFALHVLAHIKVMKGWKLTPGHIYRLPTTCDDELARLNFPELCNKLTTLTSDQKKYLSGETLISMDNSCKTCGEK
jgi:adenosylhomocysteinase